MTAREQAIWDHAYATAYLLGWLDVISMGGRPRGQSYEQWASDQADAVLESWRIASRAKVEQP